jgi:DnaK suppressor protein
MNVEVKVVKEELEILFKDSVRGASTAGLAVGDKPIDPLDETIERLGREWIAAGLSRRTSTIRAIKAALQRIADGSFGICSSCGEEISPKRIKAIPWAALCVRCQEAKEAEVTTYHQRQ